MKEQRTYEWFKQRMTKGYDYQSLNEFHREQPKMYEKYKQKLDRELNPQDEIQRILNNM